MFRLVLKILFHLIILMLPVQVFAFDCNEASTTLQMNDCAHIQQEKVEKELNAVYQRVLITIKAVNANPETSLQHHITNDFIEAQRLWVQLRKADCQNVYHYWSGGSIRNLMYLDCMQSMALQRIKQLEAYEAK